MKYQNNQMLTKLIRVIGLTVALLVCTLIISQAPATMAGPVERSVPEPEMLSANTVIRSAPMLQASTINVELCAKSGTTTLPGGVTVDIWGFADGNCTNDAQLPGPVIEATAGDTLNITLHNDLGENVSILFPGQDTPPDMTGVAPGGSEIYSFTVDNPGTFLYESGVNPAIQTAMGLYGALIVNSTITGQAYDNAATAYDVEAILVLSEIDPNLNANPAGFNMLNYAPTYWLINGAAYPDSEIINSAPGDRVLFRYLNAGFINHSMMLLGTYQQVIAYDAYPVTYPYDMVSPIIPAGQTADAIATIPASAGGDSLALYNRHMYITNGPVTNSAHFNPGGGMMTFIEVSN